MRLRVADDRNNRVETTTLRWDGIQKRSRWGVQRREEKRFETTRFGCGVLFFFSIISLLLLDDDDDFDDTTEHIDDTD